jgi:hypothetical protein
MDGGIGAIGAGWVALGRDTLRQSKFGVWVALVMLQDSRANTSLLVMGS